MNDKNIFSIIISLLAIIISLLSYLLSKRKATNEIITVNRMEWIKEVRNLCTDFLIEFSKDNPSKIKLKEIYIKILLYGQGNTYTKLFNALQICIDYVENSVTTDNKDKNVLAKEVILESQKILNGVWWRMKREAGISKYIDKRINKKYKKLYGE